MNAADRRNLLATIDWDQREKELLQLAFIDESEPYEVDRCGIFYDDKTKDFVVMTATGCSCWDGDYEEGHFATLDDVEKSLLGDSTRTYNPTLNGAEQLIKEARRAWTKQREAASPR